MLLILTNRRGSGEYRCRMLHRALKRRGVPHAVMAAEALAAEVGPDGLFLRSGRNRIRPGLVLNALFLPSGVGLELVEACEAANIPVVNTAQAWRQSKLKALTSVYLRAAGVPHPKVVFAYSRAAFQLTRRRFPLRYPIVVKPWDGSNGKGIIRLRTVAGARSVWRIFRKQRRKGYFQEFVRNPGRDIRTVIIGDRVVGATYRIAPPGRWKTNVSLGGLPKYCQVTDAMADVSLRAARAVGLDIAGIDLMEGPTGLTVLEVNSWPNFERFDKVSRCDVAGAIADYLQQRKRERAVGAQSTAL